MARDTVTEALLQIRANTDALRGDLRRGEGILRSSLRGMQTLTRTLTPVLSFAGISFGINALVGSFQELLDRGDRLGKLSTQLGTTSEDLDKLRQVAELSGSDLEAATRGLFQLATAVAAAERSSSSRQADAFRALRIELNQFVKLDPIQQLQRIARAVTEIENPTRRAEAVAAIFGNRVGKELIPTLQSLANDGLDRVVAVMDDEFTRAAQQLNDDMERIGETFDRIRVNVLGPFAEALRKTFAEFGLSDDAAEQVAILERRIKGLRAPGFFNQQVGRPIAEIILGQTVEELELQLIDYKAAIDEGVELTNHALRALSGGDEGDKGSVAKKLENERKSFTETIKKQTQALELQQIRLTEGEDAAIAFEMQQLRAEAATLGLTGELRDQIDALEQLKLSANIGDVLERNKRLFDEGLGDFSNRVDLGRFGALRVENLGENREPLDIFADLDQKMAGIERLKEIFGVTFDESTAKANALRSALEQLAETDIDIDSTKLKDLRGQLTELENQQKLQDAFEDVGFSIKSGISDTLKGAILGTQDLDEAMQNMLRNIALSAADAAFQLLVLDPILEGLREKLSNLNLGTGTTVPTPTNQGGGFGFGDIASIFTGGFNFLAGLFHEGGVVGEGGPRRLVSPMAFLGAHRYHGGGLVGTDEVPAILKRGEIVLPAGSGGMGGDLSERINVVVPVSVIGDILGRKDRVTKDDVIQISKAAIHSDITREDGKVRRAIRDLRSGR